MRIECKSIRGRIWSELDIVIDFFFDGMNFSFFFFSFQALGSWTL